MHILLYEYTTGGGLSGQPETAASQSLQREGSAMISAVAADFAAGGRHYVQVLRDVRLNDLPFPGCEALDVRAAGDDQRLLNRHAGRADWTLIIAPETGGVLAGCCRLVLEAGGRLLGPSVEFIELAADKHLAAERLRTEGVPVPLGCAIESGQTLPLDFDYPAVLKPRDGCGSQGVQWIASRVAAADLRRVLLPSRLEQYRRGLPLSVAFLCGPGVRHALPACRQILSDDGRFTYLGGSLPLAADLATRAQSLTARALAALPIACGYVGIDLVLGDSLDGSQDCVIEINPRLTTSYVGLRAACRENLADAMLQAATGKRPCLTFQPAAIRFSASGVGEMAGRLEVNWIGRRLADHPE